MCTLAEQRAVVLVVEDVNEIRAGMCRLLRSSGYRVREAIDDATAIEAARAAVPDAILTDLELPTLDKLKRCFQADPLLCDVPIIAVEDTDESPDPDIIVLPDFDSFDALLRSELGRKHTEVA